ncbi:tetratricopeptide repeat protein [Bowmanella denitrificans]|uniref:Tetratricopeptide repeat protein n=1 Tax=Bowmanella denitrificans TaxID=366582 RepID=A0ABN0XIR0_9ALTE
MKMTKNPISKLIVLSSLVLCSYSGTVLAQQSTPPVMCPGYKQGPSNIPSERVGKKIQKAFEAYNNDQIKEALDILYEIDTSDAFDRAFTDKFIGQLLAVQEGQAKKSLQYLRNSVKDKQLTDADHASILRVVADVSLQDQQFQNAIDYYKKWMEFTCKEDPEVYLRMANAYYELKQWDNVIGPADKAIALYDKPNKNPYVMKLSAYFERKMWPQTIAVAEDLVRVFPDDPQWWSQLGMFYAQVEDYKKALAMLEVAYNNGFLKKESEIRVLSQLYASNDIPYKAASIMEKHMKEGLLKRDEKNLASLANAWHSAKEIKKAANYYGQAAALSNDPDYLRRQGTLLLSAEQYKDAVATLEKALEANKDAKEAGRLHMAIMEANFYQGNFKEAYKHVKLAMNDSATARSAKSWEPYIKEKARNRGIKI